MQSNLKQYTIKRADMNEINGRSEVLLREIIQPLIEPPNAFSCSYWFYTSNRIAQLNIVNV